MDEWEFWFTRIGVAIGTVAVLVILIGMAVNAN